MMIGQVDNILGNSCYGLDILKHPGIFCTEGCWGLLEPYLASSKEETAAGTNPQTARSLQVPLDLGTCSLLSPLQHPGGVITSLLALYTVHYSTK